MKSSHELVTERARSRGMKLSIADVQRIVGTLRGAGLPWMLPDGRIRVATEIVEDALTRHKIRAGGIRTAEAKDSANMMFLADKGVCPRCKTAMSDVMLGDYSKAIYCSGCRATLWRS